MSHHWLCALPRAPGPARLFRALAVAAASIGLAAAGGCGAVGDGTAGYSSSMGADASLDDASLAADAGSCHPGDVETYTPGVYKHAALAGTGACMDATGQDVSDAFYDACLGGNRSNAACAAFKASSAVAATCAACVLTSYSATALGPIIDYGSFVGGNIAGCIELVDPAALSCAAFVQGLADCEFAACQANCPVDDSASLAARGQCAVTADLIGCASYHTAAQCRFAPGHAATDGGAADATPGDSGPGGGGTVSVCLVTAFRDFYDAVVPLFCGRGPARADAGAAAAADGGSSDAAPSDAEPLAALPEPPAAVGGDR